MSSCEKRDLTYQGPEQKFFTATSGIFYVGDEGKQKYLIEVGLTKSTSDQNIKVRIDNEKSEAIEGKDFSYNNEITIPKGSFVGTLEIEGFNDEASLDGKDLVLVIDQEDESSIMNQEFKVTLYKKCKSTLEGSYTLDVTGESGYGTETPYDYNAHFENVEWTYKEGSDISYNVTNVDGGAMIHAYADYGAQIVEGEIIDQCGNLSGMKIFDGWNENILSGSYNKDTGVITTLWNNPWGDNVTCVYTPNNKQ